MSLFEIFSISSPQSPKTPFEIQLEKYKKELVTQYQKTNKTPLAQKNRKLCHFLEKKKWTWNQFLKFCDLPLNHEIEFWEGKKGLEKAKKRILNYYITHKESPTAKKFNNIMGALSQGRWKEFGIGTKWNDFLLYCNLPLNQKRFKNEREAFIHLFLNQYKQGAIKRGLSFNLTFKFLDETNFLFLPCIVCDVVGHSKSKHKNPVFYNGIDRIDNTKGYEPNNIQPMCFQCNKIKSTHTYEEIAGEIGDKMIALVKFAKEQTKPTPYECPICKGTYHSTDKYHHSCSSCWNCGKTFDDHDKQGVKRSNPFNRFQGFHNTCIRCNPPQLKSLLKEFGF
ncbi:MAG: hypothetical protein V3U54_12805 [Thermodesulfobacteriota bacterium]